MAKVLLVDDDVDIIAMNRAVLAARGHAVTGVFSAAEARAAMAGDPPDIVVMDVMMESQTAGLELAREVRARWPKLPMIMLSCIHEVTGVPFRFTPDETWLPVQKFIDKPIDPNVLAREVEALLKA